MALICRLLPGAGAVEIRLADGLLLFADLAPGLEPYSVRKFATALEAFPKALADNSGINGSEVVTKLYKKHGMMNFTQGVDIESQVPSTIDVSAIKCFDLFITKYWALKYAVEAASTVLRVNQIIMAKRAGGPKPRQQAADADDD